MGKPFPTSPEETEVEALADKDSGTLITRSSVQEEDDNARFLLLPDFWVADGFVLLTLVLLEGSCLGADLGTKAGFEKSRPFKRSCRSV